MVARREKLLDDLRRNPHGRSAKEIRRLLKRYDFVGREGGNHAIYKHRDLPGTIVTVPRHRKLKSWVARDAVAAVESVLDTGTTEEP